MRKIVTPLVVTGALAFAALGASIIVAPAARAEPASSSSALLDASKRAQVIAAARGFSDAKYAFGAAVKRDDLVDCSSLMVKAFARAGLVLPRTAHQQSKVGALVALDALEPGDRLYFKMTSRDVPIDHTALYVGVGKSGKGEMLHAFPGKHVVVEPLDAYEDYLVNARR